MTADSSTGLTSRFDGAMTVDLEDWRRALVPSSLKEHNILPPIDEESMKDLTHSVLSAFEEAGVKATFFVLGEIADTLPELVSEISNRGHEIASHSSVHLPPNMIPREEFSKSLAKDVALIEDLTGHHVIGFRAPCFGLSRSDSWLFTTLKDLGFLYDSSVLPTWTPLYGMPTAPRTAYFPDLADLARKVKTGPLVEIPVTVWPPWRFFPGVPVGGGFYFRAIPQSAITTALRVSAKMGIPLVFYIHPGDLLKEKGELSDMRSADQLIARLGQRNSFEKFKKILTAFRFGTISDVFRTVISEARNGY